MTIQDDLSVLTASLGLTADDCGDGPGTAKQVTFSAGNPISGIISSTSDLDYYKFTTPAGTVSFTSAVAPYGAMLDSRLELRDASNNLIASANTASLGETLTANVAAGTYYIVVASAGNYGDIGQYTLTGTLPSPSLSVSAGTGYSVAEGGTVSLAATVLSGSAVSYAWDLDGDGVYGETGAAATRGDETGANVTFSAAGLDGPSTYTVSLRATAADGTVATSTATINITNVAPTLADNAASLGSLYEGSPLTLGFTAYDPGQDTISNWLINWGDGTSTSLPGTATSAPKTYADNGTYTITITATDEDGSYSTTRTLNVLNVAPTLTLTPPATINEGSNATFNFGATDPGADTIASWLINWGDGTSSTFVGTASSAVKKYADDGTYTVTLSATDEDGTYSITRAITVLNVAPTLTLTQVGTAAEGSPFAITFGATDPGADTIASWLINWGDGTTTTRAGTATGASKTYATRGTYTLTLSATDEDGTYTTTQSVVVATVAPTLSLTWPATVKEGTAFTAAFGAMEAGLDAVTQWRINWGDGTAVTTLAAAATSVSKTFADDGTYNVTLYATDATGTYSLARTISVQNVAPTLTFAGPTDSDEGSAVSFAFSAIDPGADTISNWTIRWGDGTTTSLPGTATGFDKTFADDGVYAMTLTATDEDGSYATTRSITVRNVPPIITVTATADWVNLGDPATMSVAGPVANVSSWIVDWGDGSDAQTYAADTRTFAYQYASAGSYVPTLSAVLHDGTQAVIGGSPLDVLALPTATIDDVATVTDATRQLAVDVTYASSGKLDASAFARGDLRLDGFDSGVTVKLADATSDDDGYTWHVRYTLNRATPWTFTDDGAYGVSVKSNAVVDALGRAVPSASTSFAMRVRPADDAGNDYASARQLGTFKLDKVRTLADAVGSWDKTDMYRLKAASAGLLKLKLSGLSDNADLKVFDANDNQLGSSTRGGASTESIDVNVPKGSIYVRVYDTKNAGTMYSLRVNLAARTLSKTAKNPSDSTRMATAGTLPLFADSRIRRDDVESLLAA